MDMHMNRYGGAILFLLGLALGGLPGAPAAGQPVTVKLIERAPDPHGTPRPARGARDVPLLTSLYFELGVTPETTGDEVRADSVTVRLEPEGGEPIAILEPGQQLAPRCTGWLRPRQVQQGAAMRTVSHLAVYLEPAEPLKPATTYNVRVAARSRAGATVDDAAATWRFTTAPAPEVHPLSLTLDLDTGTPPVQWRGAFFSGLCNVIFCSQAASYGPTYDLMAEARKLHPRAWSYQRDFWMTGSDYRKPGLFNAYLPNIVRERETRRIAALEDRPDGAGALLRVEDFFGHEQYGIPGGRPVSQDYHPGDEVLIADGIHDAQTRVISVDDTAGTISVGALPAPPGGWKIDYEGALPQREDPDAPGLFPPGGCYLRKLRPHGTAHFYWGRLDKEWDLVHRRYGRRLMVNFADAPGDLARDGRSWTTVKDYAQWHDVAGTLAGHIIDRYGGADALTFTWSIFNEPDLGPMFWRASWDELQRFYDYTTDAILRAFEDRGLDSDRVQIGGLELGAIFGTHLKLQEFLAHCSPRASASANVKGALARNAAVADPRLDGKRSRRVEALCRAHDGKGAPCDFISIHAYNRSEVMAAKLIRAKEMALEIDPDYYRDLWISSHESCPDWSLPPDEAAADSYLGNGYFPTWCADVVRRQLTRAAADPRFAFGETILTVWPPPRNFAGMNAVTRIIHCDDDGDGRTDRQVTIPMPIFHVLGLLSDMGDRYQVLPEQQVGGHVVAGFASRADDGTIRVLLYSHNAADTQSRSDRSFAITLDLNLAGLAGQGPARVREYRFDRDHNSYYRLARSLRELPPATPEGLFAPPRAYPRATVEKIQALAECHPTASASHPRAAGRLRLTAQVAGNGLNFLVIEPDSR
jgi:hypothetical protein